MRFAIIGLAVAWAQGCLPALDACSTTADCSAGLACVNQLCVPEGDGGRDAQPDQARPIDAASDAQQPAPTDAQPPTDALPDAPIMDMRVQDAMPDQCTADCCPTTETCNARDDDCDGRIDELVPVAPPIGVGLGGGQRTIDVQVGHVQGLPVVVSQSTQTALIRVFNPRLDSPLSIEVGESSDEPWHVQIIDDEIVLSGSNNESVMVRRYVPTQNPPLIGALDLPARNTIERVVTTWGNDFGKVFYQRNDGRIRTTELQVEWQTGRSTHVMQPTAPAGFAARRIGNIEHLVWADLNGGLNYSRVNQDNAAIISRQGAASLPVLTVNQDNPTLISLRANPVRIWAQDLATGRQGPLPTDIRIERPTALGRPSGILVLGWRTPDDIGMVTRSKLLAEGMEYMARHAVGNAAQPPSLAIQDDTLLVGWSTPDGRAFVQQIREFCQ